MDVLFIEKLGLTTLLTRFCLNPCCNGCSIHLIMGKGRYKKYLQP